MQKENQTGQFLCASHLNSILCNEISTVFFKISNQDEHEEFLVTYNLWLPK